MDSIWNSLSGWKQIIGTVLLASAEVGSVLTAGSDAVPDPTIAIIVKGLGWAFLGIGSLHRIAKNVSDDGRN